MSETQVYLDYAASAPLRPEVRETMLPFLDALPGNPSSIHGFGRRARAALEDARARLAAVIGATPAELVFTHAGTEADNLAVLGRARAMNRSPVVCSAVEHRAVLGAAREAEREGSVLDVLPVDGTGSLRTETLRSAFAGWPAVVSVMWVNNEVGVIQPIAAIAGECAEAGVTFHSDAVQALGKVRVRVDEVQVDMLSFSAHKLGGPKGIGALYVRRGTKLTPLLHGGGQERGLRPGTEDVAGAVGFAAAAELAEAERVPAMRRLEGMRDRLEDGLRRGVPDLVVNGEEADRVAVILNVSVPGADPEALLAALDLEGIAVSSGSACSSGAVDPSHVLTAMGIPPELAGPSVRFSLGWGSTDTDVDRALTVFPPVVERLRAAVG